MHAYTIVRFTIAHECIGPNGASLRPGGYNLGEILLRYRGRFNLIQIPTGITTSFLLPAVLNLQAYQFLHTWFLFMSIQITIPCKQRNYAH